MRRIICQSVNNLRNLGGYMTLDKKIIKFNSIYRSDVLIFFTENELNFFKKNNLTTIIDLRTKAETLKKVNYFRDKQFDYYNIPLKGEKCPKSEKDISYGYIDIIDDKDKIKLIFDIIKNSQGSVFINCNSGKDRTGVICMLLLLLVKASEEDIISDYQVSYTYLRKDIRKMHQENSKLPIFLGNSKPEYMEKTLELFKEKYKTIENYMSFIGLTNDDINIIINKITCDLNNFNF